MTKSILCSILLLYLTQIGLHAQVLEDYSQNWEVGERESWFGSSDRISQEVDLEAFPLAYFYLEIPGETVVFADEKLWFYVENDTIWTRQIQDVAAELEKRKTVLSLYRDGIGGEFSSFKKILNPNQVPQESQGGTIHLRLREDKRSELRDFFGVAVLLILSLGAFYKQAYPNIFRGLLSPKGLLSDDDFSELGSLQKFFSLDILFFVFLVNLLTALVGTLGFALVREDLLTRYMEISFGGLLTIWFSVALFLLLLTVFKFIGIRIFAYLFDLGKVEFPHFFYLLRLIVWAGLLVMVVCLFCLMNSFFAVENVLQVALGGFFWMYLLGIAGLFLIMMNKLSFKKYHLFTYLCIAELVPFLIFAKWIMILGQ